MPQDGYSRAIETILTELLDGPSTQGGYVLNPGDAGLLGSLEKLALAEAQPVVQHVDHLRYGFNVLNRWQAGQDDAFATADWGPSWRLRIETDKEWSALKAALQDETGKWRASMGHPRQVNEVVENGIVGIVAHLAYHLGAMRQLSPAMKGPKEGERAST